MSYKEIFIHYPWWGKLLGAFFGYLIGGPAGALFGILIGNFFDRGIAEHLRRPHLSYYREKREYVQKIFFEATFAIMGHIAKADGRVSENEIQMAKNLMNEMRLHRDQKNLAKEFFNEGKKANYNTLRILSLLKEACLDNHELLTLFMDIQYRAAQTDGLTSEKIESLDVIFRQLGFAPLRQQYRFYEDFGFDPFNRSKKENQRSYSGQQSTGGAHSGSIGTLAYCYALLEIPSTANQQEVKRAYRRSMSRNHPDKLIAKGLPEQMIKMATDKTQKIQKAYEQICQSKGW